MTKAAKGTLRSGVPVLPVMDLGKAVAFYRERLGFRPLFCLDTAAAVTRDGVELHFWPCKDPELPRMSSCRIVVEGIRALYAEYQEAGVVHPNGKLTDQPWGYREFVALDLDGNALKFAEELNPNLA